jgi:hypothetical protein
MGSSCCLPSGTRGGRARRNDQINIAMTSSVAKHRETLGLTMRFAEFNHDVLTLPIAGSPEALAESVDNPPIGNSSEPVTR